MNLTPQWLAVSSGPLSQIHLDGHRCGLPRWDNTIRPLLCDSLVSIVCRKLPNLHILSDLERNFYLQNRNGLDWM